MTWAACPACGAPLMPGEACAACPARGVIPEQLRWDPAIRADFSARPVALVGEVSVPAETFPALVWDLTWLSQQDPWANAAAEGEAGVAGVAFFGRFEGRPFVIHDVRAQGPKLYVVGHDDLSGQAVLDAIFASLARRPWFGHAEPARPM